MAKSASETASATHEYEPVIGLEVHVQLLTKSKIFCGCSTRFGDAPNSNVCPICLGLPGTLPVLNKRAVEMATLASLALNCTVVHEHSRFARKNYFYPDLPKGYQISQYELPLATNGWIELERTKKHIGITRLHLEEDAAKNLHEGFSESATKAYIDFNRCGTPLCEIVSEPDMRSAKEAHAYLTALRGILVDTGVSDCNMEEGSLRCDANISVRLCGSKEFGTKVEIKNLNSFRFLQKAIDYEIKRQVQVIEEGGRVRQETRLWNQAESYTSPMRSKEEAHDYRYFPEPDLLPVHVPSAWREEIRSRLPELRQAKRSRFAIAYGITPYEAEVLTGSTGLADYFEAAIEAGASPKPAANWMQTELLRRLKETGESIDQSPVRPAAFAEFIKLLELGKITPTVGKKILALMFETRRPLGQILDESGLDASISESQIEEALTSALWDNFKQLQQFKQGKLAVRNFFIGYAMKRIRGKADHRKLEAELDKLLSLPAIVQASATMADLVMSEVGFSSFQTFPDQPRACVVYAYKDIVEYPELWKRWKRTIQTTTHQTTKESSQVPTQTSSTTGAAE